MKVRVREYSLAVNTADCVGCCSCEVACKQEHGLPVGPRWIRARPDGSSEVGGHIAFSYTVIYCRHCRQPRCQEACSAGAITRREDGIVLVREEMCTGCGQCVEACPFGAMQFDEEKGVAQKCDLCISRVEAGGIPACAAACPARCILFRERSSE